MKRILYAIYKNGIFKEAAYCVAEFSDDADRYIKDCQNKYGLVGLTYKFDNQAIIPDNYTPRIFFPRISMKSRGKNAAINSFWIRKKHDTDDGVNYE